MDRDVLDLLFQQNLSTMKSFVELMFDSIKKEVQQLRDDNTELKRSLEFTQSELDEMKRKQDKQTAAFSGHGPVSFFSSAKGEEVSERLRQLEDRSRRRNMRLEGLAEASGENSEILQVKIQSIIGEKLQLNPELEIVHRLGTKVGSRPRSVMIRFKNFSDRQACSKAAPNLRGTNLYLNDDVSKATLDIRKGKMDELKEKRKQGLIAYFSGDRIVTRRRGQSDDLVDDINSSGGATDNNSSSPNRTNPSISDTSDNIKRPSTRSSSQVISDSSKPRRGRGGGNNRGRK